MCVYMFANRSMPHSQSKKVSPGLDSNKLTPQERPWRRYETEGHGIGSSTKEDRCRQNKKPHANAWLTLGEKTGEQSSGVFAVAGLCC